MQNNAITRQLIASFLFLMQATNVFCSPSQKPIGQVEKLEGDLSAFYQPTKFFHDSPVPRPGVHVFFADRFWIETKLAAGDQIYLGDLIRCTTNCKAQIRLENDNLFILNQNSYLNILESPDKSKIFKLESGELRGVLNKIENMSFAAKSITLKTQTADFFIANHLNSLDIGVLLGNVEINTKKEATDKKIINEGKWLNTSETPDTALVATEMTAQEQARIKKLSFEIVDPVEQESQTSLQALPETEQSSVLFGPPPVEDFSNAYFSIGGGATLALPTNSKNSYSYSSFSLFSEYDLSEYPFGAGLILSAYSMNLSATDHNLYTNSAIEIGSATMRLYYRFDVIRFAINAIAYGSIKLKKLDGDTLKKQKYRLSGLAPEIASNFPLTNDLFIRAALSYSYLTLSSANESFTTHNIGVGAFLVAKF